MILNRTRELMAAARIAVARALAHGLIRRAKFCSECGRPSHKIEGHHKDYAQPLVLEWLCRRCHKARHQEEAVPSEKRVRPRCLVCGKLITLWLMDNGAYTPTENGPIHKLCAPREQKIA